MYISVRFAAISLWVWALTLGFSARAHKSNNRLTRHVDVGATNSAFIPTPSQTSASFMASKSNISHSLRAKNAASGETITKKQLVAEIAQTVEMTQKDVGLVIDEFIKSIGKYLRENKEVSIPRFGLFHNSLRGARTMKNLQTGEMYTASPVYVPNLRFYDAVKEEINQSLKPE